MEEVPRADCGLQKENLHAVFTFQWGVP